MSNVALNRHGVEDQTIAPYTALARRSETSAMPDVLKARGKVDVESGNNSGAGAERRLKLWSFGAWRLTRM